MAGRSTRSLEGIVDDSSHRGCEECRTAALRGMAQPLVKVATHKSGCAALYRCIKCGAWWEEQLREAHVISESEAQTEYSSAFQDR